MNSQQADSLRDFIASMDLRKTMKQADKLGDTMNEQPKLVDESEPYCPKCRFRCRKMTGFYYRGDTWPGWICTNCNALWEDKDHAFLTEVLNDHDHTQT